MKEMLEKIARTPKIYISDISMVSDIEHDVMLKDFIDE